MVIVTGVNYFSVRLSGAIQVLMTALKILTVLLIIVGGLLFGAKHAAQPISMGASLGLGTFGALLTALVPAMWAYNGFNDLGDLGEEIKEPGKNIPRSILLGLAVVGALYLLVNFTYFRVLPFSVAATSPIASDAVQSFAGSRGAVWLTLAMALSALGALHVVILTGARVHSRWRGTESSSDSRHGFILRRTLPPALFSSSARSQHYLP